METRPITAFFAAEIAGVDPYQPIDEAAVDAIWSAIDSYAVVIARDQRLSDAQLRDCWRTSGEFSNGPR